MPILTVILTILIFGLLIFVHELGHFLAARAFDVKVTDFAIGMGPAIWKKQKGETLYAVRAIPIGGYCKMEGEDEEEKSERSFSAKPWWARIIILVSGAVMNILLGFVLCLIIVAAHPHNFGFWGTLQTAFATTWHMVYVIFDFLRQLISGEVGLEVLSGPVGVGEAVGEMARQGVMDVVSLAAFMTVNLGVMNLLPLPALDGGRIIFTLIEGITGKALPPEKEGIIHFVGIVLLFGLMIFVTYNDIVRCFSGG